jgi:hypothetical protein
MQFTFNLFAIKYAATLFVNSILFLYSSMRIGLMWLVYLSDSKGPGVEGLVVAII